MLILEGRCHRNPLPDSCRVLIDIKKSNETIRIADSFPCAGHVFNGDAPCHGARPDGASPAPRAAGPATPDHWRRPDGTGPSPGRIRQRTASALPASVSGMSPRHQGRHDLLCSRTRRSGGGARLERWEFRTSEGNHAFTRAIPCPCRRCSHPEGGRDGPRGIDSAGAQEDHTVSRWDCEPFLLLHRPSRDEDRATRFTIRVEGRGVIVRNRTGLLS